MKLLKVNWILINNINYFFIFKNDEKQKADANYAFGILWYKLEGWLSFKMALS